MRQRNSQTTIVRAKAQARRQSAARRAVFFAILLGLVTTALSGCVFVPLGGYGHEGHGDDRHGYERGHGRWG
jgi:hypothetical protein